MIAGSSIHRNLRPVAHGNTVARGVPNRVQRYEQTAAKPRFANLPGRGRAQNRAILARQPKSQ
eukprot:2243933-Rhodomonas_salina.1